MSTQTLFSYIDITGNPSWPGFVLVERLDDGRCVIAVRELTETPSPTPGKEATLIISSEAFRELMLSMRSQIPGA